MKHIYLLFVFYTLTSQAQQQCYPYSNGEKWGLTNEKKEVILPPQFDSNFLIIKNKFAIVKKNNKLGVINTKGKTILPFQYDEIEDLDGANAKAALNGKYVFVNYRKGGQISPLAFDDACSYLCKAPENIVIVKQGSKRGFFNVAQGKLIGEGMYDDVYLLRHDRKGETSVRFPGVGTVKKGNKYGVLNLNTGKLILDIKYNHITTAIENGEKMLGVETIIDGNYSDYLYYDLAGKPLVYRNKYVVVASDPSETENKLTHTPVTQMQEDDTVTVVDLFGAGSIGTEEWRIIIEKSSSQGTEVLETYDFSNKGYCFLYKLYYNPAEGVRTAKIKATKPPTGVIDVRGNVLVPFRYDNIEVEKGYYKTLLNGKVGVLSLDLVEIKKPVLNSILDYDDTNVNLNAWLIEMHTGQQGYMNKKTGKVYIPGVED